ncbi:MAG: phage holin family protein [Candidatus Dormibacteria bacterium]
MAGIDTSRPDQDLKDLGREITSDAVRLVRAEINLAKAEAAETIRGLRTAIVLFATASIIVLLMLVAAFGALADGVGDRVLGGAWKGWGILALMFLLAAGFLGYRGYRSISRSIAGARDAVGSLKEDVAWLRRLSRRNERGS